MVKMNMAAALAATLALSVALPATAGNAADAKAADTKAAELKTTIAARFPTAKIESIRPSAEIPGLFELVTDREIVYIDGTGNYLISGHLMDTRSQVDITAQRWDELHAIDFAALPLDHAIKRVQGNGSRKLALFADPDCPFCQELEHELKDIKDVTIYTFLFPLVKLHPDAYAKSVKIWCAPDRGQAWSSWMLEKTPLPAASCEQDVIDKNLALGQKLGVGETPTLFFSNGRRVAGALSKAELEAKLAALR